MSDTLPAAAEDFHDWPQIEPFLAELVRRPLDASSLNAWMADWTRAANLITEAFTRASIATSVNTVDAAARDRLFHFLETILPRAQEADQALKLKFLSSGLAPAGFEVPLRNLRAEAELYRAENLPLLTEEGKLSNRFDEIKGDQTVPWEGRELPLSSLTPWLQSSDRATRERAWRLGQTRNLADRGALNDLWAKFLDVRLQMARNAGFSGYTPYRWKLMKRFDYTPADSAAFRDAIETVVVPAVTRLNRIHREGLGVPTLRPWDVSHAFYVDRHARPPLRPYESIEELDAGAARVFASVDPVLGGYYDTLRRERLLDLDSRKGKAPGGYCATLPVVKRPFIFMNGTGLHGDVETLLHEGGHAFHVFESASLPSHHLQDVPMEFAEVASMSMELLAAPGLARAKGGFYTPADAARAMYEHFDGMLRFWPYMAVVDAFQHWVYERPDMAADPAACDAMWSQLFRRFHPDQDWTGLEAELANGWHQKLHIFQAPFYYVEYGLAQLGAAQIWRNAAKDPAGAVAAYRRALALGGSVTLPALFSAAGARFGQDAALLGELASLMERTMADLRAAGG